MMISLSIFFILALLTTISGLIVIMSSNIILSVIALVNVFLLSSILTMMAGLNFLALTLILIYVGAIAIFFLFAIMMLDIKIKKTNLSNKLMFLLLGLLYLYGILPVFLKEKWGSMPREVKQTYFQPWYLDVNSFPNWYQEAFAVESIQAIGQILYTNLFIHFLIAGYILFIAIVGSMLLTLEPAKKDVKNQRISEQMEVKPNQTIKKCSQKQISNKLELQEQRLNLQIK